MALEKNQGYRKNIKDWIIRSQAPKFNMNNINTFNNKSKLHIINVKHGEGSTTKRQWV